MVKYSSDEENNNFRLEDVICKADFEIREKVIVDGNILQHDIKMFFENIVKYLEDNGIQFSKDDKYGEDETCVIACGVLIVLHKGKDDSEPASLRVREDSSLRFHVSTYNFHQSFAFFISLLRLINLNDKQYIRLHLNDKYDYIDSSENRSSIISEQKGFDLDTTRVDTYVSSDLDLSFHIFDFGRLRHPFLQDNVVSVVYSIERVKADQIVNLVSKLIDIGLIFVR